MDFLKELFGDEALTFEQLSSKVAERGFKVADLSTGNYVAKKKFDDEVTSRDATITDLTGQIKTRDTDINKLKKSLEDGGKDNETKVADLTSQLETLQGDYKKAKTDYEARLSKQSYEFAVREFANEQKFSSNAAKRDFINEMISAGLVMKDNSIMGATDFVDKYKTSNSDAFVVETPKEPEAPKAPEQPKPMFVQPTPPAGGGSENPFMDAFSFTGVR